MQLKYFLLFLVWGILYAPKSYSQLGLKVGYLANVVKPDHLNELLSHFNEERPWMEEDFAKVQFLNGIELGVSYRWDIFALDATYSTRFKTLKASGVNPVDESDMIREINMRLNGYALDMEWFFEWFSIGVGIGNDKLVLKKGDADTSTENFTSSKYVLNNRIFIGFNSTDTGSTRVSIRPFVKVYWDTYDLTEVTSWLDVNNPAIDRKQNFFHYGLMIVFTNGQ